MVKFFTKVIQLVILSFLPDLVFAQPHRIMCLGNSITQGNEAYASYRFALWKKLVDAGIDFEFVGSQNRNKWQSFSPQQDATYNGKTFTNINEGHWGWRVDEILNEKTDVYPPEGKLSDWLEMYTPDFALLHLGSNDIFQGQDNDETIAEVEQVINALRGKSPTITILLAQLIPSNNGQAINDAIQDYNSKIKTLGATLNSDKSPVIVVDMFTGFDAASLLYDEAHPNEQGEEIMAQRWFDVLQARLVPLPVTLISFNAGYTSHGDISLNWKTASEQNNLYFEVQRGTDSIQFSPIATINGAGTTQTEMAYTYLDTTAPTGKVYYRLKQVDTDGSSTYSKIVQVKAEPDINDLMVYPTVTRNESITLHLQQEPNSTVELVIYAANGTLIQRIKGKSDLSGNFRKVLDIENLQGEGLYLVKSLSGAKVQRKFIVEN